MKLYITMNVNEIDSFSDTIDDKYDYKLEKIEVKYPMINLYLRLDEKKIRWNSPKYSLKERVMDELCYALSEAYLICDDGIKGNELA